MRHDLTAEGRTTWAKRYLTDRADLVTFANDVEDVYQAILTSRTVAELDEIRQELHPYFIMRDAWNFNPTPQAFHLKRLLGVVDKVDTLSKQMAGLLGVKLQELPKSADLNPNRYNLLWEVAGELGIDLNCEFPKERPLDEKLKELRSLEDLPLEELLEEPPLFGDPSVLEEEVMRPSPKSSIGKYMQELSSGHVDVTKRTPQGKKILRRPEVTKSSFQAVLEFFSSEGLIGEERLALVETLAAIHQIPLGVESLSGSGKSKSVDILMKMLPESAVYVVGLQSPKAMHYDSINVNKTKIIYIPELQKAMNSRDPFIIDVVKDLFEKKDSDFTSLDPSRKVRKRTIKGDKGIIFTLAVENAYKYDTETARRFMREYTDPSKEQTKRVIAGKTLMKRHPVLAGEFAMDPTTRTELLSHVAACLEISDKKYEIPFADYLQAFIPLTLKARSYDDYYFGMIEAVSHFHYSDRLSSEGITYVELSDAYAVHELAWHQFCKSLLGIPLIGEQVLELLDPEEIDKNSFSNIFEGVRAQIPTIRKDVVQKTIDSLERANLIEGVDGYGAPHYRQIGDLSVFNQQIDWQEAWDEGYAFMEQYCPNKAKEWATRQIKDGVVVGYHPLTGEVKELAKSNIS